jgi:arylsulfatase A-like enzyme
MSSVRKAIGRLFLLVIGFLFGALFSAIKRNPASGNGGGSPVNPSFSNDPNFLVFILDDLDVETMQRLLAANQLPNIKSKIVDGATYFQNAVVSTSMCTASRASFLTGRFAHNHGAWQVIGSEGPEAFDTYLRSTGNAYLPTWLGNDYYRAFIGKVHLGRHNPNWNFYRPVDGYDPRPAMYKATENGVEVMPPVYQTKYIGDSAKQAIRTAGNKPFFVVVAPNLTHVNVANWRNMESYQNNSYTGYPVGFAQFRNESTSNWRQHLVTVGSGPNGPIYRWFERDSKARDSGWGRWTFTGNETVVTPGTGDWSVCGWNVFQPVANTRRQQLVKNRGTNIAFYTRDLVDGQPPQPWVYTGDQSILAGTGSAPVAGWSAIVFRSGLIRQEVVRGTDTGGYTAYYRHLLPAGSGITEWQLDPDWGEAVAFGRVRGLNLIPTTGAGYIVQFILQPPGTTTFEWWQSPEFIDFQELSLMGNDPGRSRTPAAARIGDEGKMLSYPFMKGSNRKYKPSVEGLELAGIEDRSSSISQVHPYFITRAFAEGSWSPVHPGQTYSWGSNPPAGRFRQNRAPHGFQASSPDYDLPYGKESFNQQRPVSIPFYSKATWPDLDDKVQGGKTQQDYLRRLYLDRLEQLLSIDRMVGDVIDAAGSNTIIIFTSDNGHIHGEQRLSNKLTPQDESIRVPLYIKVPGGQRQAVSHLAVNIDLAPTILDYAGKVWNSAAYNVDGRSLRPILSGGTVTDWRRSILVEFHKPRDKVFSPTDWRFGLSDYLGLREISESSTSTVNNLYTQYYHDANSPETTIAVELYKVKRDPYQMNNRTEHKLPRLDQILRDFYTASGEMVRQQDMNEMGLPDD